LSALLQTRALAVGYAGVVVATLPDLSIDAGDRIVIRGPNGSGKTTVLKTLAGLIAPVSGTLTRLAQGRQGAVYVHPAPYLFDGTGAGNVLLGAHGDRDEAARATEAMGAAAFADRNVHTLSNGQRQRLALARALAARPALLLVDEPENGLDAEGLEAWQGVLRARVDLAIVVATHREVAGARCYILNK
jgi:ABC-type cobalamin/Fe3+-siderophores transport system ATPase subunit